MQTVTGRLTADAIIKELKDGRKLLNFSIAENDRYKHKSSDEIKEVVNFYNCSYWISTSLSPHLLKGALVEVSGRIGLNVWNNLQGEARASLTLHVNHIKLHGKFKNDENHPQEAAVRKKGVTSSAQDLPF